MSKTAEDKLLVSSTTPSTDTHVKHKIERKQDHNKTSSKTLEALKYDSRKRLSVKRVCYLNAKETTCNIELIDIN